jgi:hypothetical protein
MSHFNFAGINFVLLLPVNVKNTLSLNFMKMKKMYLTMLAIFAMATAFAHNVTFKVDLGTATPSANGVHVAGSFQNPAWTPGATTMTQVGATSVYQVTVVLPTGNYEFKFLNGNAWGDDETPGASCNVGNGNPNRWVSVWSDTILPAVMFGGCAPAGMNSIMLMVDMSTQAAVNDTVSVAGNFQGWSPGATIMSNWFNDSIFRAMAYVPAGDTIQYKYINGTTWPQNENVPGACAVGGNRQAIAAGDIIAGPTCFNMCGPCFVPDTFNVTIRVDLSGVCANIDSVDIAGPLNGWAGGDMMTDMGNGIWEITVRQAAPSFKFKARHFSDGSSSPNWEGGGDKEPTFSSDTVLPVRCFGADVYGPCAPKPAPADITFRVDFAQSNYTPATDIYLIGDFTGYQANAIKLNPTPGHPGVYETTVVGFCPASMNYKFVNGDVTIPANEENPGLSSCGVPNGVGGYNRYFLRPDANPHTLQFIFDSCQTIFIGVDENIVNQNVNITPNPFSTTATVDLGSDTYTMTIMDVTGRLVRQVNGATGNVVINRDGLKAGIYFMNAVNNKGQVRTAKFVIE